MGAGCFKEKIILAPSSTVRTNCCFHNFRKTKNAAPFRNRQFMVYHASTAVYLKGLIALQKQFDFVSSVMNHHNS
jgi:hypothetical protein